MLKRIYQTFAYGFLFLLTIVLYCSFYEGYPRGFGWPVYWLCDRGSGQVGNTPTWKLTPTQPKVLDLRDPLIKKVSHLSKPIPVPSMPGFRIAFPLISGMTNPRPDWRPYVVAIVSGLIVVISTWFVLLRWLPRFIAEPKYSIRDLLLTMFFCAVALPVLQWRPTDTDLFRSRIQVQKITNHLSDSESVTYAVGFDFCSTWQPWYIRSVISIGILSTMLVLMVMVMRGMRMTFARVVQPNEPYQPEHH